MTVDVANLVCSQFIHHGNHTRDFRIFLKLGEFPVSSSCSPSSFFIKTRSVVHVKVSYNSSGCYILVNMAFWPQMSNYRGFCFNKETWSMSMRNIFWTPWARSHFHKAGPRSSYASFIARSSCLHLRGNSSSSLRTNVTIPSHWSH